MKKKLEIRFKELTGILLEQMNSGGYWDGELSSSALGVSVAVAALHFNNPIENQQEIKNGLDWLCKNINSDGSYGDTPESPGNNSTSLLVYAAINLYSTDNDLYRKTQNKIAGYLLKNSIDINSAQVSKSILAHYKKDYTFSVPILTMCALCGVLGDNGFKNIPQLPFELALMPPRIYRMLNLSVVSYAIPALIAVGIVIHKKKKQNFIIRSIRKKSIKKALKILEKSMPASGGFLEAIPLTAFVSLGLTNAGFGDNKVVREGINFLKKCQREDGSWPIDINLSTWVTTLSVKALRSKIDDVLKSSQKQKITKHLISTQNKTVHPFNGTPPGGWGWTNYSGSVPDCDDTPGSIMALLRLNKSEEVKQEVFNGVMWLLKLQNNDGGFPTFAKGWGKLPFDQSCADLTGHACLAIATVLENYNQAISKALKKKLTKSLEKSVIYLKRNQLRNGSWLPLWFGNQHTKNHTNPVYGTARVVSYLKDARKVLPSPFAMEKIIKEMIASGIEYLKETQNADGSWGGDKSIPGSIEETSLALSVLSGTKNSPKIKEGYKWLNKYFESHGPKASPIGLYFASLWYDEKLYPLTMFIEALSIELESNQK